MVRLSEDDLLYAARVGCERHVSNLRKGLYDRGGTPRELGVGPHVDGAIGELVFCRWMGLEWEESTTYVPGAADALGYYEVKASLWRPARYLIIPRAVLYPDRMYVLVTGGPFDFEVRGQILGADAGAEKYWGDPIGKNRPAYFVPVRDLMQIVQRRLSPAMVSR